MVDLFSNCISEAKTGAQMQFIVYVVLLFLLSIQLATMAKAKIDLCTNADTFIVYVRFLLSI